MMEADVVIVGAGPAGSAAALALAPARRVLVVERHEQVPDRIGDSLAPAARRLLVDLGVWEDFLRDGHAPCYAARSTWGSGAVTERDTLGDLDGHGWHIDRRRFEARLRAAAVARGATLLTPARVTGLARTPGGWEVRIDWLGRATTAVARIVLDCGGRASTLLRPFGAERDVRDRLICGWVTGRRRESRPIPGVSYTESAPDGWWYTAPMADGRRVLAWHTDSDLPAAALVRDRAALLAEAGHSAGLAAETADADFRGDEPPRAIAAYSSALAPPAGDGWLAAGDAATGFDPLSSQGLFHALYTGRSAAMAADRALAGDISARGDYAAGLSRIDAAYRRNLAAWYGLERRWPGREFWRRRGGMPG
ncbi:Putative FAD-dependent oxidoreductase LodB [Aquisphaera giovannonii]|uniref:FAD-dependent oxidoreductase LodB n=1 Tax=Aquisphaera giovannonii TaxID=406548 RepID=A0A5B9WBZ1_9BACT|nr:FAD-dependent oxidoreductase [Aquisphaera giovannonii]QEH38126.1 Putative FAD-dependent oxidoreductase LodB [Aquisphaera giovannonii]